MKKSFSLTKILLLVAFAFIGFNSYAADCGKLTDKFCKAMSLVTIDVKKCQNLDQLQAISFDNAMNKVDFSDIDEDCIYSTLTPAEKTKLKAAINTFFDAMADKSYEFTKGILSRSDIDAEFNPIKKQMSNLIDSSSSFMDFATKMATLN